MEPRLESSHWCRRNPPFLPFSSCSGDKTVCIWEQNPSTSSWDCKAVLDETHTRTVRSCAWSPSGNLLATARFDATTAIWENVGGDYECVVSLEEPSWPWETGRDIKEGGIMEWCFKHRMKKDWKGGILVHDADTKGEKDKGF
ncbi:protein CIA1-like [Pyrus x bretschneideri]|uniref:protein CIA1-like n=1 Tax=Pyrus x bretschneideri TaxID=225117 RepID=UPI00202DD9A3|nr:protein CIA1-like [Pyrus x bretschneideri]